MKLKASTVNWTLGSCELCWHWNLYWMHNLKKLENQSPSQKHTTQNKMQIGVWIISAGAFWVGDGKETWCYPIIISFLDILDFFPKYVQVFWGSFKKWPLLRKLRNSPFPIYAVIWITLDFAHSSTSQNIGACYWKIKHCLKQCSREHCQNEAGNCHWLMHDSWVS